MAPLTYYRERNRKKGRLIGILSRATDTDHYVTVAVCGRGGEETKVHRVGAISRYRLLALYQKTEVVGPCVCCFNKQSSHAPVECDEDGDCFDFHKVFICGGCGRVAPWCYGGDREPNIDPDGDLCSDCAVANMRKNEQEN